MVTDYLESPAEEVYNALTHFMGLVLSVIGFSALIYHCWNQPEAFWGAAMFAGCQIVMYLTSTLYHWCEKPALKIRLHKLDHIGIHLVIAGSYTPYLLMVLPEYGGVLLSVWLMAIAGILFILLGGIRYPSITMVLYMAMGWMALFLIPPLSRTLGLPALTLLVTGGIAYTVGSVFYATHWFRYSHAVWHLFVMGGSACHFASVWLTASQRAL